MEFKYGVRSATASFTRVLIFSNVQIPGYWASLLSVTFFCKVSEGARCEGITRPSKDLSSVAVLGNFTHGTIYYIKPFRSNLMMSAETILLSLRKSLLSRATLQRG
eukprot:GHVP01028907.1.p1 GENE.GHVP01028907.1~~GHVP01028907.1.p1  ORF type:complete len:106 (+),score=4.18 GHVP01028907.1:338-655(+)